MEIHTPKYENRWSFIENHFPVYDVEDNCASTWRRYGVGYRIQDLNEEYYEEALKLLEVFL